MDVNSFVNLERLKQQLFMYKSHFKSPEQKESVSKRLRNQLIESKAIVRIQRMDVECESLMMSLKRRLMLLQGILIPKEKDIMRKKEKISKLNLDSSDEEILGTITEKMEPENCVAIEHEKCKLKNTQTHQADSSESIDNGTSLSLALRRKSKEGTLSYKSNTSSSTLHSRGQNTKSHGKREHAVSTSGVTYCDDRVVVDDIDSAPTLHIKIPSLHRGNVHYIILDSLKFARKVFDYRAGEVKQQTSVPQTKIKKSHKKHKSFVSEPVIQQITHQRQNAELSQLIQNIMSEACNDETLQATNTLQIINNNIIDNYDPLTNDSLSFSQSSQEISFSQNSNIINDMICSANKNKSVRKARKNFKRINERKLDEPPNKRGRKSKKCNISCDDISKSQSHPPRKSNLAKYVEYFANDCDQLMPGSSTPAASSTMSQPLVSSTTHHFEIVDQQDQQQPITYYIDGDWANGGPCQLVPTNRMSVDVKQLNSDDMNVPFQDFVNYIDDNSDTGGSNVIARVLDSSNSIPKANMGLQNLIQAQTARKTMQSIQNSSVAVINIQIPTIPSNIEPSPPPPAHLHEGILDLTVKSKTNVNIISTEVLSISQIPNSNFEHFSSIEHENWLPLDLSAKSSKLLKNNCVPAVDNSQDDDFIRRLIETSDFDYTTEENRKESNSTSLSYDVGKSFKAVMDMPLLEFDDTDLVQLVKNSTTSNNNNNNNNNNNDNNGQEDNCTYHDYTNSDDANYVSMATGNLSIENNLHFSDRSTKEIFEKLLDIGPDNEIIHNINNKVISDNNLNESIFHQTRMQNSTMCETENATNGETQLEKTAGENKNNSAATSPIPLKKKSLSEMKSIDEIINNGTVHSSVPVEISAYDKTENLKTLISSDLSLKFSDTEETNSFNSSKVDTSLNLKENEIHNSHNMDLIRKKNEPIVTKPITELAKSNVNEFEAEIEGNNCLKPSSHLDSVKNSENVVFSVTKIALSDDDNLYTDSDTTSGKSFEGSKSGVSELVISNKSDNEIKINNSSTTFTNQTNATDNEVNLNSSLEDINYSCMEDVRDNPENNTVSEQKIIDPFKKESKLKSLEIKDKVREKQYCELDSSEKCTLLELESKVDDPLDFEEDLDDALSLATSCFDSPNDDRFVDSTIDASAMGNSPEEVILEIPEDNSSLNNLMKHFKIPKITNSDTESNIPDVKVDDVVLCNTVKSMPIFINMEKITRTVKNDVAQSSPLLKNIKVNLNENIVKAQHESNINESLKDTTSILSNVIDKLFGITCLPHLVDKCYDTTNCQLSHQFNDPSRVFQQLNYLSKENVNLAYQFQYNHFKLFKIYFKIFCTYYTAQNDRKKLLNMVNDCERYPEHAEFIIDLYEGLVKCGFSRANACRQILKRNRETTTSILDTLVTIIFKSDWTMFSDYIEKYTQEMYKYNFRINVLEQMAPAVLNSKGPHLKQVFGKCVQMLHCEDTGLLLNSPNLIQCVALLTQT